ncbi:MAG: hypothetical protein R3C28_32120 [Pirellulaceae bacterium]
MKTPDRYAQASPGLPRLVSILMGATLFWVMCMAASTALKLHFAVAFVMTMAFWLVTSGLQIWLSVRLAKSAVDDRRFGLGTMMLCTAYVAIYLGAIRALMQGAAEQTGPFNVTSATLPQFAMLMFFVCVCVSLVQLHFNEAIMALLVRIQQRRQRHRRNG